MGMIDAQDLQPVDQEEVLVVIHMASGETFTQPIPLDDLDYVQEFMDWYRNPGKEKVWAWHCLNTRSIHLFQFDQIAAVDIEGYIEPDGRPSRWYERLVDRFRAWRYG